MANMKHCDRCKKTIENPAEIGIVVGVYRYRVLRGYIRPTPKLLTAIKEAEPELDYCPIEFEKQKFGELDLCSECFAEFMKLK